jgi:DNA polymerase-3 subunit delta
MRWDAFFDEVKRGALRQAYLFGGPEEYVKREALARLREAMLPEGLEALNETQFEGVQAEKIVEAAETLPVLCERRLVVVKDFAPLMTGKARDEEGESQKILAWLERPCDTCVLVFYMRGDFDGRKKLSGALKDGVVSFDQLAEPEMRKWISAKLKPFQKTMSIEAIRHLLFTAGWELTKLDGELSKLAAYVGDRAEIGIPDIEAIVSPSEEFGAFDMINKLFDGDAAGAYETLLLMLEQGMNRIAALSSITRQMRGMAFLRAASEAGARAEEAGRALALNPYAAKIMGQKARNYDVRTLETLYRACIDADYAVKSGQARDQAALDNIFIKISLASSKSATKRV